MKNYFMFMFKYMNLSYFIFSCFLICGMGIYFEVNHFFMCICYSLIGSALLPSKIELEQAEKEGLIKSRGGKNEKN